MPTNQQRRDAERRRLQQELEQRRVREAARQRTTLIVSIVGALVLVAAVVIVIVVTTGGSGKKKSADNPVVSPSATPSTSASTAASAAPVPVPTAPCAPAKSGSTATFKGLTVTGAKDLKHEPKVKGKSAAQPAALLCQDLVVGTGAVAKTTSQATVEYVGLLYKTGAVFQSSWTSAPATFPLATGPQGVIPGFSQGIAGAGKVAPMRAGGRRILILPGSTAYGANPPQGSPIPPNATLVFVVDLQKVTG